jgi:hypothetical protein
MLVLPPEMQKRTAMKQIFGVAAAFAVVAAWAAPARADDVATICRKLGTAAAGVTSFVVQLAAAGTRGISGTLTFVRPMKVKSDLGVGGLSIESYLIDGIEYVHGADGWQKMSMNAAQSPQQSANIAEGLKPSNVTLLPDREQDGMDVGAFAVDTPLPEGADAASAPASQHVECTYDKSTYRLSACSSSGMTMTYTRYNDPANTVVLPPEARSAGVR